MWWGKDRDAARTHSCGNRSIVHCDGTPIRIVWWRDLLQIPLGVIVGNLRLHVESGADILFGCNLDAGIVVVSRIWFLCAENPCLLYECRAGIERVAKQA